MIELTKGRIVADVVVASGALAWTGRGWIWEWPLRFFGRIEPEKMTIVTKTLTPKPRRGNLRWWHPWTCVRFVDSGVVNAVDLSNLGVDWWIKHCYPITVRLGYRVVVSVAPDFSSGDNQALVELANAVKLLARDCPDILAIEYNASCPNTGDERAYENMFKFCSVCVETIGDLPLLVKLGVTHPVGLTTELAKIGVAAIAAINSVPWRILHPDRLSPLKSLGGGGVSGPPIFQAALNYCRELVSVSPLPVIAGGGIFSLEQAVLMAAIAPSISLGSIFLCRPMEVKRIVDHFHG